MIQSGYLLAYVITFMTLIVLVAIIFCIVYTIRSKRTTSYSCFIAGATTLSTERDAIRAVVSEVNNQRKRTSISAYTFEDFPTSVVVNGPQEKFYNKFLRASTDIAVFIIDGEIGKETANEFDVAFEAYEKSGKPIIYVYCKEHGKVHEQAADLKKRLENINHYWTPYRELSDLKLEFKDALTSYLEAKNGNINIHDGLYKERFKSTLFLIIIGLLLISIPIASKFKDKPVENIVKVVKESDIKDTSSIKTKTIGELMVKDSLISHGSLTIDHSAPVKYHITSEDPTKFKIDWNQIKSTLEPGATIYPKSNSYICLHAEDNDEILEKNIWFSFSDFVEYSIIYRNQSVLEDMFYSLEDSDGASYILNDTTTDFLTRNNAAIFMKFISKMGYKITHLEFSEELDITSAKYPKIKLIKCSKKY